MSRALKFIDCNDDPWQTATVDDAPVAMPAAEPFRLLTLAQWQAVRDSWPAALPVALVVGNDVDVETLAADLPRFAVVALQFPKWVDGRAYSQARLLRARFRFAGEIRATGEVLADMLPLLQRTGFDAVALRPDQSLAVARRALGFFAEGHYQGDLVEPRPLFARAAAA
ncbi:MAG: DUF934 domain-containing protein [Caldimonas sp.]